MQKTLSKFREKKESRLVFTSSTQREIRYCHVVVVQRWQRNAQQRVMYVQSCCFSNLNPGPFLAVLRCRLRCRSSPSPREQKIRSQDTFRDAVVFPIWRQC